MFYLSGVIIDFFLVFILLSKKGKNAADYVLAAWLSLTGLHLFSFYLFYSENYFYLPGLAGIGFSLPLIQGPFLYIYTKVQTSERGFRKQMLLHFIPVLASILLFGSYYLLSSEEKIQVFKDNGVQYQTESTINIIAIYLSGIIYIPLALRVLIRFRKSLVHTFSNTEKISFNWLLYLIIWLACIWIVILIIQEDIFIFGSAVMFVVWIGYYGIRQVSVFHQHIPLHQSVAKSIYRNASEHHSIAEVITSEALPESPKYQNSSLTEEEAKRIHTRLLQLFTENESFKDPELTLSDLAEVLDVHPNHLSQVINSIEQKSFYDLINERRIQAFLEAVNKPENQQYTFLALAFSCGFNSKASFNRNFKKITGQTPSDYLKSNPIPSK